MTSGPIALTKWQAAIEAARGTAIPATRKVYWTATPGDKLETYEGEQDSGTYEKYYPQSIVRTKRHVEVNGTTTWTFEDAPWWYQAFIKGGVTGSLTNTAAYTYTFSPTAASDDLSTVCLEFGTDTAAYSIPFGCASKLELSYSRSAPVMGTIDILGQQMTSQAFTGAIGDRVCEALKTGATTAYVDTTTIGSTAPGDVLEAKVTLDNAWEQIFPLGGTDYPTVAVRQRRFVELEATLQFDTTTEYAAAIAETARKIRLKTLGTAIAGCTPTTYKEHSLDIYVPKWKVADFGRLGGIWTVKFSGSSAYDSGAGVSFSATVVNGLSTLP